MSPEDARHRKRSDFWTASRGSARCSQERAGPRSPTRLTRSMSQPISPALLRRGETLFNGIDLPAVGHHCTEHEAAEWADGVRFAHLHSELASCLALCLEGCASSGSVMWQRRNTVSGKFGAFQMSFLINSIPGCSGLQTTADNMGLWRLAAPSVCEPVVCRRIWAESCDKEREQLC